MHEPSPAVNLADSVAQAIHDAFEDYHARFREITQRAKSRFEQRAWLAAKSDAVERIELYDQCIAAIRARLVVQLGARAQDRGLWAAVKRRFAELIEPLVDGELYKTFFNTLTRRFFGTQGVDADVEFVALEIEPTERISHPVARRSYTAINNLEGVVEGILQDYSFSVPHNAI